ncbi:DEAD/DEAH box helicase [Synergistaceae bacterium OttesenSCG-928-D05]|nr:DEAD/DEAH box helicase [Synergistaceae bacterium OttesenSCG-928-D05]
MFANFFGKKKNETVQDVTNWIPELGGTVTYRTTFPAREAAYGEFGAIDARLIDALKQRGIERPYTHQSKAASLALAGRDLVVVTPTASGKTLCYNIPVIETILQEPTSRALYLFPTKALAQDQLTELSELSEAMGGLFKAFTYDGDTQQKSKGPARDHGNIIISNPDMLSTGILPHHARWAPFFKNLKYIVVDELHSYRGIFGSHLANLFFRLLRVCAFHGSRPVFICCSATIANPREHAEALTGRPVELISENGAPSPEKEFLIYNPPVVDKRTGMRRSSLFESARITAEILAAGISTIIFTRSRINVELLLKYVRKELKNRNLDPEMVTGYRAGYLPKERRAIEADLRSGELRGVVSTNALELGIDIGSLDFAVLHGYPGSIASMWQQVGRAGRRSGSSAAVLIASALTLDQFFVAKPEWLLGASPELARIDPRNPYIRVGHVRCSAFELPFIEGETFGGEDISEILNYLAKHDVLHMSNDFGDVVYHWQENSYPAASLSLRSATNDTYAITDITNPDRPKVIGSMDRRSAPTQIYPGAIYFHGGESFIVQELDTEKLVCSVKQIAADYYTESESTGRINVTEEFERRGLFGWGEVLLSTTPSVYRKIKLSTHENLGLGEIKLPEEQMETTACWIEIPEELSGSAETATALGGLSNLLRNIAPLFLMCDRNDIQVHARLRDPYLKMPALYVVDNIPGGVGLAEGVFELKTKLLTACLDALRTCKCQNGCPACVGAMPEEGFNLKGAVQYLLTGLLSEPAANQ